MVNTADSIGGGHVLVWDLFLGLLACGINSYLLVGRKASNHQNVFEIPNDSYRSRWARCWLTIGNRLNPLVGRVKGVGHVRNALHWIGQPRRLFQVLQGHEDFDFPGTQHIITMLPVPPDIIHCHNLHGGYFDLRYLASLSRQVPVILTLHDAWLLGGHCGHSLGCERWKKKCGHCPDLTLYPSIRRDGTEYNWMVKSGIFKDSHFHIVTPSRWLMDKVTQSILSPSIVKARVIPNGIDLTTYFAEKKDKVRDILNIPQNITLLLIVANRIRRNTWKDYATIKAALAKVVEYMPNQNIQIIALGEEAKPEAAGKAIINFLPYQTNPKIVAMYYQSADLFIHSARADTFPSTVLEALACGTSVVATAVGGIPEQIKGLRIRENLSEVYGTLSYERDEATGILVPPSDPDKMARAIIMLLSHKSLREQLSENAVQDMRRRFGLDKMIDAYTRFYREIILGNNSPKQ